MKRVSRLADTIECIVVDRTSHSDHSVVNSALSRIARLPVAPLAQPVCSKTFDGGDDVGSNLREVTRSAIFHPMYKSGYRLYRGYTKTNFTVGEGKGPPSPVHDKKRGEHRRSKVKCWNKTKTPVSTVLLCAPG